VNRKNATAFKTALTSHCSNHSVKKLFGRVVDRPSLQGCRDGVHQISESNLTYSPTQQMAKTITYKPYLQVDQLILGPSQRSAHESAGSESRLRRSFISRYHRGSQGRPANERCFNALQPFATLTLTSLTPIPGIASA
jgi:hypothetical protein